MPKDIPIPYLILFILILAFALFFSTLAVQQHQAFLTNGLDLGNVDQALWNTAQGRFLQFTLMHPVESRLALHVEPILFLFVPLYWLGLGGPELLLIAQAIIVALGAWPLYQLAIKNHTLRVGTALSYPLSFIPYLMLTLPISYLLYPPLQSAVLFDFHAVTLAPTFILFALWALETQQYKTFFLFAILTMACKEDMPLLMAMVGIYAGLQHKQWRLAGLTIALSTVWFIVAFFIIQPMYATSGNIQLDRYAWLGNSPLEMLTSILSQPIFVFNHLWYQADISNYLFNLTVSVAFLCWFSPITLLPIIPTLAINLLSANPFMWRIEDFHYVAPITPFIFIAALRTIETVNRFILQLPVLHEITEARHNANRIIPTQECGNDRKQRPDNKSTPYLLSLIPPYYLFLTTYCLLLIPYSLLFTSTLIYHYHRGYTPLSQAFIWPEITAHHQQMAEFIKTIPRDVPLFSQPNLAPHLSQRQYLYNDFGYFTNPNFSAPIPAQGILLDITSLKNNGGLHDYLQQTLPQQYMLQHADNGLLYFSQLPSPEQISLTFTPNALPQYHQTVVFGEAIQLHGYTLHFNRQEEVEVTIYLEPIVPLIEIQPILYLTDISGNLLGATTDKQPLLVWHPPEQWVVGEMIQLRFNTLPWHTREMESYRLALGVVQGTEVWEINQRLRPNLHQATEVAPRLLADGTLLELTRISQTWHMPQGEPLKRQLNQPTSQNLLAVNFNQQISLIGYDQPLIKDDTLTVTLYWQALADSLPSLTRFAQLVGPGPQVYGQNDSTPDKGQYPTTLWQAREYIVETVSFPLDSNRPVGEFALHIGFYDPVSGERLPTTAGGDHSEISVFVQ